tara:strand:- start:8012 stop:8509 length:498 start_codon:yes stop_codon:yes gene_type:complete
MQHLHSYWRTEYIECPKNADHKGADLFVELPKAENDRDVYIIWRGKTCYLILNKFPYNAGHLMAVPFRKVGSMEALQPEERTELMDAIIKAQNLLTEAIKPNGFNIGINVGSAAGAGIPDHIHVHIVPRWEGDTNFMPVTADTKILSQGLDAMWERLSACLKNSQ